MKTDRARRNLAALGTMFEDLDFPLWVQHRIDDAEEPRQLIMRLWGWGRSFHC